MMRRMPTDIELLLTRIGSEPVSSDSRHFYALRRALLNSRYFESHRKAQIVAGWVSGASVAFAQGVVVFAIAFSAREALLRERPAAPAPAPLLAEAEWGMGSAWNDMAGRAILTAAR